MRNHYYNNSYTLHPYTFTAEANEGSKAPSNALRIEPEFKEGYWPCEKEGEWVQVEDNRNKVLFSTENGQKVELKEIGAIPENMTTRARPDDYHRWNGTGWELTDEAEAQKAADDQAAIESQAKQRQAEASQLIAVLQDRIDLEDYTTDEELASIQADLKNWKKYRIELTKFLNGQREDMPTHLTAQY